MFIDLKTGRLVEYSKENILNLCSELTGLTQDESYSYDKWTYGYKYNHAGVREQKRLFTSDNLITIIKVDNITIVLLSNIHYLFTLIK